MSLKAIARDNPIPDDDETAKPTFKQIQKWVADYYNEAVAPEEEFMIFEAKDIEELIAVLDQLGFDVHQAIDFIFEAITARPK